MPRFSRKPRHIEKREYQSRRIILQRRLKKVLLLISLAFILWLFIAGDMGLWTMWQSIRYKKRLERVVQKEEKKARELDEKIEKLQSDTLFIERTARYELGMIRDNEKVFIFKENDRE